MKPITIAPKGTRDITPAESYKWQYVERTVLSTAENYGFFEIRVPTFEHTELFLRGVGDTTDVVSKEMYTFKDKGERSVTLRPEGTSGVMRAAIENNLLGDKLPLKLSYNISCFRYEKPQAGRMREFHQFGVEEVGSPSPIADAEVIAVGKRVLEELGIKKVKIFINSIGCKECRPTYQKKLKEYLTAREGELCDTCKERLVTNPLRIIDCKSEICSAIVK
ncbi:MAG: histidine--tRNA ligase, partial [Oscillospiraceae bacterium]